MQDSNDSLVETYSPTYVCDIIYHDSLSSGVNESVVSTDPGLEGASCVSEQGACNSSFLGVLGFSNCDGLYSQVEKVDGSWPDPGDNFWLVKFASKCSQFKNTGCLCGENSGMYVQIVDPDVKEWIFFLEGGGSCYSKESCYLLYYNRDKSGGIDGWTKLVSSKHWPKQYPVGGFTDPKNTGILTNKEDNPFAHYNKIIVPYCTQDVHLGRRKTGNPWQDGADKYRFRGYYNVKAAWTVAKENLGMNNAVGVVFAGYSAGAVGAQHLITELPSKNDKVRGLFLQGATWPQAFVPNYGRWLPRFTGAGVWDPVKVDDGLTHYDTGILNNFIDRWDAFLNDDCVSHMKKSSKSKNRCFLTGELIDPAQDFLNKVEVSFISDLFDPTFVRQVGNVGPHSPCKDLGDSTKRAFSVYARFLAKYFKQMWSRLPHAHVGYAAYDCAKHHRYNLINDANDLHGVSMHSLLSNRFDFDWGDKCSDHSKCLKTSWEVANSFEPWAFPSKKSCSELYSCSHFLGDLSSGQ